MPLFSLSYLYIIQQRNNRNGRFRALISFL
nr:MAG TPA: hypothetical protein [Caudoviricetes sp.]